MKRKLVFATKINDSEYSGLIDISKMPPEIFCLCDKDIADEILLAFEDKFEYQMEAHLYPELKKPEWMDMIVFDHPPARSDKPWWEDGSKTFDRIFDMFTQSKKKRKK